MEATTYTPTMDDAIIIADGSRGIYATQHAAKVLLANMRDSLIVIRDGDPDDLRIIAAGDDDLNDDQQAAYDDAVYQFERMEFERVGYGIRFYVHFDGDVWLVPVGVEFPQL